MYGVILSYIEACGQEESGAGRGSGSILGIAPGLAERRTTGETPSSAVDYKPLEIGMAAKSIRALPPTLRKERERVGHPQFHLSADSKGWATRPDVC